MLIEPRHDLYEIAGHVPVIKLRLQNSVPCILAGTRGPGKHKHIGCVQHTAGRA